MSEFDHILNWTLKKGSHEFPGPDGGTCINEAAIVVAGFRYQPVHRVEAMPGCFSRPICRLALRLNDDATDEQRQKLIPFVPRLACADMPEIEAEREAFITAWMGAKLTFNQRLTVLEGALMIGRQAEPVETAVMGERLDASRREAMETPFLMNPLQAFLRACARARRKHLEPA